MTPFPGGLESVANGTLILSAALAAVYLYMIDLPQSWKKSAVKTGSIALLCLLCLREGGPALLAAALALSALGDLLLSREGERYFLGGLAAFLLAHLAYVALFAGAGEGIATLAQPGAIAASLALAAICAVLLRALLGHIPAELRLPVCAYTAAILAMGVTSLATGRPMVVAGALMFMASDSILAWERFAEPAGSPRRPPMRNAVWALYYVGQALIALGFLLGG